MAAVAVVWLALRRLAAVVAVGADGGVGAVVGGLPQLSLVSPVFTLRAVISVANPLCSPGFAELKLHPYRVNRPRLPCRTDLISAPYAQGGSIPMNISAITSAMVNGDKPGPDPARRYWAAISSGLTCIALAVFAGSILPLNS